MHLGDEQVQRILHSELLGLEADASRHLAVCAECRRRIEEAAEQERRVFNLLHLLDHSAPELGAERLAARVGWTRTWGRRAAGIVLALGVAGAAYAAPGSPVPRWVDQAAGRILGSSRPRQSESTPAPTPPVSGIAVTPGERFTVRFAEPQSQGSAMVRLTQGTEVIVRASNGVATFTSGVDGLTVNNANSSADYDIELPANAQSIEVRVGSRSLLRKVNGRIVAPVPPDSLGHYRLALSENLP